MSYKRQRCPGQQRQNRFVLTGIVLTGVVLTGVHSSFGAMATVLICDLYKTGALPAVLDSTINEW